MASALGSADVFRRRLSAWHERLRSGGADAATQGWLAAVAGLLEAAVDVVERDLDGTLGRRPPAGSAVAASAGAVGIDPVVLGLTRRAERRVVWLERLFAHYRSGFEQRLLPPEPVGVDEGSSPPAAPAAEVLDACDALVRSCWLAADWGAEGIPPPPMPYLDALPAPEAYPASLVPADLQSGIDAAFLAVVLPTLPVSLVRVPERSSTDLWLLGLLAHECGHHLQHVAGLRERFRRICAGAAAGAGGRRDAWEAWSDEVFADLVSVHLLGPAAAWPIMLLELDEPGAMVRLRGLYPPPAVRLALLDAVAGHLGFEPGTPAVPDLPALPDHDENVAVASVAATADRAGPDGRSLRDWLRTDVDRLRPGGRSASRSASWAAWFRGTGLPPAPSVADDEPRMILAGLLQAHAAVLAGEAVEPDAPLARPSRCLDRLSATRPAARRVPDGFADAALAAGRDLGVALAAWDPAESVGAGT